MIELQEGNLLIEFSGAVSGRKFDDVNHQLSHCMKAVDFIIEYAAYIAFIEIKDPDAGAGNPEAETYIENFKSAKIDRDLALKYRDSFLYEWASGRVDKPIHYYVLIGCSRLTTADLLVRTDALKRWLPTAGPKANPWKKQLVAGCAVMNVETWKRHFPEMSVSRIG